MPAHIGHVHIETATARPLAIACILSLREDEPWMRTTEL
jgi:hypothetical protein